MRAASLDMYLRSVTLLRDRVEDFARYPFSIPAVRTLHTLEFHPRVTFLVGENGTGKSTLIEAIAVAAGFNAEGGTTNFRFSTRASESSLHRALRLTRGVRRPKTGFFLRAESFFNVATEVERLGVSGYGDRSLHEQSHGESFMALVNRRFGAHGLYLLDEPEAALSPQRQLALVKSIHQLAQDGDSQFIIATHSPLLLAYPEARIYALSSDGAEEVRYEHTEHFSLTNAFLKNRRQYLDRLFAPDGEEEEEVPRPRRRREGLRADDPRGAFLRTVTLLRDQVPDASKYPFDIPALRELDRLDLHPRVTFFVGENGTGKSTLVEAIAVAAGFNPEGGSVNFSFGTRSTESELSPNLRLVRGFRRPQTGFFLRAESFFNVASHIEEIDRIPALAPPVIASYGGRSLHEQSHGESFMTLVRHRFGPEGLYVLDEPEAALSPQRQLALLKAIDRLAREQGSQFVIATHSPILIAYPEARIYALSDAGAETVEYEQTEHVALTTAFLQDPERYLKRLLATDGR